MQYLSYGPITCHIDLDSPGKRFTNINLNYSDNRHSFSSILIPIAVIKGKDEGPTVLLSAGNHGDEYEGQCLLRRLIQEITSEMVKGRVIVLPALNSPAVREATRISPLDNGNLNRSFPGASNAGPTKAIAGFVVEHLFPIADFGIDFHSGGSTATYVNTGYLCAAHSPEIHQSNVELVEAFGAPFTMVAPVTDEVVDMDSAAHQMGLPFISCELGGAGTISPSALKCGWEGLMRVLVKNGIINSNSSLFVDIDGAPQTCFVDMGEKCSVVTAKSDGFFVPSHELGSWVSKGQVASHIYSLQNTIEPLEEHVFAHDGVIVVKRRDTLVRAGDHLYCVAEKLTRDEVLSIC
ncbi:succinylglutamate desuccinylase/aspartoacylase family protein [Marinomonas sp.]|nr:succinylglutamate desuccinylase/aspartoacylase family protein [Marinomonas sp.]MDB4836853.1 succinylglutamate desuccinylase/aspartoacylase family protein [Marinomonas sp.]